MMDQSTSENVQRLPATDDKFGGVVVEMKEHMDSDVFRTLLKTSMSQWKLQGKKGIWIKLPIYLSHLVDTAVKMLVVQEKMGLLRGVWKISTGIIHQGEDITAGVAREVKEETGIDTEFVDMVAFSQEHNVFFGKSEVLFLCMMRPLSFEIQIQETEIEAARWMPLEEYEAQLSVQERGLRKYITKLCKAKSEKRYSGLSPVPVTTDANGNPNYIYVIKEDLNKIITINNPENQV